MWNEMIKKAVTALLLCCMMTKAMAISPGIKLKMADENPDPFGSSAIESMHM